MRRGLRCAMGSGADVVGIPASWNGARWTGGAALCRKTSGSGGKYAFALIVEDTMLAEMEDILGGRRYRREGTGNTGEMDALPLAGDRGIVVGG